MNLAASFYGIEMVQHLNDAPVLQIEQDEAGMRGLQAALPRDVIHHAEDRLRVDARLRQRAVDRAVIALDVVFVEYCEPPLDLESQPSVDAVCMLQKLCEGRGISRAGRDQGQHEESVTDKADSSIDINDSEAHIVRVLGMDSLANHMYYDTRCSG